MVMVIDSTTKISIFKNRFCSELKNIRKKAKQFTQELCSKSKIFVNYINDTIIRNTLLFTLSKSVQQNELYGQNKILVSSQRKPQHFCMLRFRGQQPPAAVQSPARQLARERQEFSPALGRNAPLSRTCHGRKATEVNMAAPVICTI